MSDHDGMQGLWRLVSRIHAGRPVHDPATHYMFSGNTHREIVPSLVDDGKLRSTFTLDEAAEPQEIVITLDYNGPDGPPDPNPIILRGFYRLAGERLEICFGPRGAFPDEFSDQHGLISLQRDTGPIPESRKPSGTPPLIDEALGQLIWDDNLGWYHGKVESGGRSIGVSLNPDENQSASAALARAKHVFRNMETYAQLARRYAAAELLDLKNDSWRDDDEEPLTPETFMSRITLESMVFESDGKMTFYHHDGDLFWGHCVQICFGANDQCVAADIPG